MTLPTNWYPMKFLWSLRCSLMVRAYWSIRIITLRFIPALVVDSLRSIIWINWSGWAVFIGRIHSVASSKAFEYRPTINTEDFLDASITTLQQSQMLPNHLNEAFMVILQQVSEATKQHYNEAQHIRLHGDCHPGNILWRDGPSFVDLDDCRMGPSHSGCLDDAFW